MTLKQKQALLAYLGYYDGPLDGLWGEKSQRETPLTSSVILSGFQLTAFVESKPKKH